MLYETVRTQEEVDKLAMRMEDGSNEGTKYPGMSYEEGALAMLEFLEGRAEAEDIYEE